MVKRRRFLIILLILFGGVWFCLVLRFRPYDHLHDAVYRGDAATVKSLLAGGTDANARSSRGRVMELRPFWRQLWSYPETDAVTPGGPGADWLWRPGNSPLDVAIACRNREIIGIMIDAGADLRDTGYAILRNDPEQIDLLVSKGWDVNRREWNGFTPLHFTASWPAREAVPVLRALLGTGADLNAQNQDGSTPLHLALQFNAAAARILIESGARLDVRDRRGETPLHAAYRWGREDGEIVGELIRAGADIQAKNGEGLTPEQCKPPPAPL